MKRNVAAVIPGLLLWAVFGSLLILALRLTWPAYEAAHPERAFTPMMQIARLAVGAAASLAAGAMVRRITGTGGRAVLATGLLLFLFSVPIHLSEPTWSHYPGWYHLIYLGYLVPLTLLGGRLPANKAR